MLVDPMMNSQLTLKVSGFSFLNGMFQLENSCIGLVVISEKGVEALW